MLEQRFVTKEQQRWATKLLGLDFIIEYKPGTENKAADALSRRVQPERLLELVFAPPPSFDAAELLSQVEADPELRTVLQQAREGKNLESGYTAKEGLLCKDGRVASRISQAFSLFLHLLPQFILSFNLFLYSTEKIHLGSYQMVSEPSVF